MKCNLIPAHVRLVRPGIAVLLLLLSSLISTLAGATTGTHAIAMHGKPKYEAGFLHFDYVNPEAPKGGELVLADIGTYDSLNPFVIKGQPAGYLGSLTFDTLMVGSADESFSQYGLIAERIEIDKERYWVRFHLNPKARFHDGSPITAEDVKYTFELLTSKGSPFYAAYYADVDRVTLTDQHQITFHFKHNKNRELPLILGQLPVLSRAAMQDRPFDGQLLDPLLGSGPYRVAEVKVGQRIVYERVEDYWAKDHPVNKGRYNFDRVRVDYYRDPNVALEAFKAGAFDFQEENSARRWAESYTGSAFETGELIKRTIEHTRPAGMQAFVFNTRRALFQDPRVRQALGYAFDFEWANTHLFYGAYKRSNSFFSNSELAATGLPSEQELALLEPFRDQLPNAVFTQAYQAPVTDGSGNIRNQLRQAAGMLDAAGWTIKDKKRVHATTGQLFKFEILLISKDFERIVLPFTKNLERLGIEVVVRIVDQSEYINRIRDFSFDMIVGTFAQSSSPGNEQRDYWFSEFADRKGSRNLIGVKHPAVDALIEHIINAEDRAALITACRALDRVLLWQHYVIPQWHINSFRIAHHRKLVQPAIQPKYDVGLFNWWINPAPAE